MPPAGAFRSSSMALGHERRPSLLSSAGERKQRAGPAFVVTWDFFLASVEHFSDAVQPSCC